MIIPSVRGSAILAVLIASSSSMVGAEVLNQNFSGSTAVASYYNASAPTTGQFNDISAEATGGTWSINGSGQLQIVRAGSYASTNGAGFMRWSDFSGPPTVLHVAFDFGVALNSWQNDSMSLEIGKYSGFADYNNWPTTADTFLKLNVDGASSNTIRFESNSVSSGTYAANGSLYHLEIFLNKSGSTKTYRGPDATVKTLDNNRYSFWVGTTCVFDNLAAGNGSSSALSDLRFRLPTGDNGTWLFDNFLVKDVLPPPLPTTPSKLVLTPSMMINELAAGDAGRLVDEQALAGDPLNTPPGGAPLTKFEPPLDGARNWSYPLNAIIDLGAPHVITNVAIYDSNGQGNVTFSSGTPFNWIPLFTDGQTSYNSWKLHPVTVTTRYIQVSIASSSATPNEVVVYGYPLDYPAVPPAPIAHTPPTFDQFMGVNTFSGEPLHRQQAVGILREYHDWSWNEGHTSTTYPGYPNNQNGFSPAWTGENYDPRYENFLTVGLNVSPAIQGSVRWLHGNDGNLLNNKPILINSGRNPNLPSSYVEHADHMFQYVARYGAVSVADNLLKLRADNPRVSGLNLIDYYENWNEQDKWWKGQDAYFTPYQYAAMSSADYDGHLGTMGGTVGLRNADSGAKLVMAGLARTNLDYIKALKLWCDGNRGGDFVWDAINIHHYSNNGGEQFGGTSGISPEADDLRGKFEPFRAYRDQYLPGVELWVSEFGYDTDQVSTQKAPPIGTFSAEEVQGQWLVRSYLALAAAGVDRAFAYHLTDFGSFSGVYATCGLITTPGTGSQPKPSWWYVYTLKNRLAGLRFDAEQSSGNPNVRIYRFKDAQGAVKAYVVWCPTSSQTSVNGYSMALQGSPSTASLVTMQIGDPDGVKTALPISGGAVTLNVGERPVFVLINHTQPDFELTTKLALTPSMVVNESGLGNAGMMVDEQATAGDPREASAGGAPSTVWAPGNGTASAYIDLGSVKTLDRIFIRDVNAIGDLIIESGSPGNWTPVAVESLSAYMSWKMHVVDLSTRYVRFTRVNGSSNFSEVVLYGK